MFVSRKHNKSGSASVQAVAKIGGKYRVWKSFGSSCDEAELTTLEKKARQCPPYLLRPFVRAKMMGKM